MSGYATYLFRWLWLSATVLGGAVLLFAGEARVGTALLVVGLGWLVFGFLAGFAEAFVRAFLSELREVQEE